MSSICIYGRSGAVVHLLNPKFRINKNIMYANDHIRKLVASTGLFHISPTIRSKQQFKRQPDLTKTNDQTRKNRSFDNLTTPTSNGISSVGSTLHFLRLLYETQSNLLQPSLLPCHLLRESFPLLLLLRTLLQSL